MAQKKKLGARGHRALLEHSPEFGAELETTHSLQLCEENQNMDFSRGHRALLGSSGAQPRVWERIGDHSQSTTLQKKSKHGFLNAMYPTALLSPRNLYKLMQYKVNPNKERREEWGGT